MCVYVNASCACKCAYIWFDITDCIVCEWLITSAAWWHKHDPDWLYDKAASVCRLALASTASPPFLTSFTINVFSREKHCSPWHYARNITLNRLKQIPNVIMETSDSCGNLGDLTFGATSEAPLCYTKMLMTEMLGSDIACAMWLTILE